MNRRITLAMALFPILLIGLMPAAAAQDAVDIGQRRIEDPLFGVSSVVPQEWQDLGNGIHARGTPPEDLALVAIQSVPASIEELWASLLPQFGLDEAPAATGELPTERFGWTLYRFDTAAGSIDVAVELALAADDGSTHLVLLQADPAEFDALREEVLVPAIEAFEVLEPEATPDPATLGYEVEEVTFPGGDDDVELAATLTRPSGPGPHPAVVLMSGSGAQDRDESLRPITTLKPFALIADALTSAGVAVLRYDDRGVGGSSGDYEAASVQQLAADGAAALGYLAGRNDIDPERTGILGHSEGGIYAAILGAADPDIDFIVAMAPPAVDGVSLLVAQNRAVLEARGESETEVEHAVTFAETVLALARDADEAGVEAAIREYTGGLWDRRSEEERAVLGDREAFMERQVEAQQPTYLSDWFRSLLAYDPAPDWQAVDVPVVGLFGARDVQVPLEQNEPAFREALEAGGNDDAHTIIFPDANHLFQASETGALEEYGTLEPEFTADFLPALVEWVTDRVGIDG